MAGSFFTAESPLASDVFDVQSGRVAAHSKDRDEAYRLAATARPKRFAIMSIHRKWMQLSLRWALLITTIICLWLGWQTHIRRRQARALAQIRELGGNVQADAVQSSFLVRLLNRNGSVDAGRVTDVNFLGPIVSDSDIDDIARCASLLPELENITLMETAVTPAGERKLREKLPDLQIQVITPILDRKNTSIRRY